MQKEFYQDYLSDPDLLFVDRSLDSQLRSTSETQFALGNGYIGSRAVYEEIPKDSRQGTFFAGVFDPSASKVSELVNAPNPFDLRISTKEEKLKITTMDTLEHKRILDIRKGLLTRHTVYKDHAQNIHDYQSLRFISMDNLHLGIMQVKLTPLVATTTYTVNSIIDTSVTNHGVLSEGDTRHFHIHEVKKEGTINYIAVDTLAHNIVIAYANQIVLQKGRRTLHIPHRKFEITAKPNETITITKYITFYTSREIDRPKTKRKTTATLKQAVKKGFDSLLHEHEVAFEKRWSHTDIVIEGDVLAWKAIRFNIYHLLITTHEKVTDVSIGAKALTGEGYRGHVFWDTEILMMPFFKITSPKITRNLLEYRFNRLSAARSIAKTQGYEGARYPWESAETGSDETPTWAKDFDGTIIRIHTGEQELHITADIFYAVYAYYIATSDHDFMLKMGIPIIVETTRYWKSRLEYDEKKDIYEITGVVGPDEFRVNVNNNTYTNVIVAWQLEKASILISNFKKFLPKETEKVLKSLKWKQKEAPAWRAAAKKIKRPFDRRTQIIPAFDGFSRLMGLPKPPLDEFGVPTFPDQVRVGELYKTLFQKQADVIMLLHLFPEEYPNNIAIKNYQFYEPLTLHKSSLSAGTHAVVAAQLGLAERAYHYFRLSSLGDLKDIYSNTCEGIHAASQGATWQVVIRGFCGIRILMDILSITPCLPSFWKMVKVPVCYHGKLVECTISQDRVELYVRKSKEFDWLTKQRHYTFESGTTISIYGEPHTLKLNQKYTFNAPPKRVTHYTMEPIH